VAENQSARTDSYSTVSVVLLAPARHFTAFQICKPKGAAILREEGDDPVCDDPEGTDRAAVHRRILQAISDYLGLDG